MANNIETFRNRMKRIEETYLSGLSADTSESELAATLDTFAGINETFAVYEITQQQPDAAKQYYYLYGRLQELAVRKYHARLFNYSIKSVGNVLLSDNAALIKSFAALHEGIDEKAAAGESAIWCHTVLMFVMDDQKILERNLQVIEEVTFIKDKTLQPFMQADLDFFKALYNRDVTAMEQALEKLTSSSLHAKRNKEAIMSQHISQPALSYAKLAWYKGFEVVVNSPLVPKELLPVKPLDTYDDVYDFLKK
jgi:hypothetical protein